MPSPKMERRKREARERILFAAPEARQAIEALPPTRQAIHWPTFNNAVQTGDVETLNDLAVKCRKIKRGVEAIYRFRDKIKDNTAKHPEDV